MELLVLYLLSFSPFLPMISLELALWVLLLALRGLKVTHMLYADDLTLTAKCDTQSNCRKC